MSAMLGSVLASIPSPSSNSIHIGPLQLRAYGLMIALGVVAASWLFGRRLERTSTGTKEDASSITMWAVVAGILGARLYHVITDWNSGFTDNPLRIFKIWEGGLGIPGGLMAGIGVGIWRIRKRGLAVPPSLHAAAPTIPLAQAIGRWGNWWNQEVFGRPTTLPWGLEIDDAIARGAGDFPAGTTFHPTFLYESLGNFALCGLLIWFGNRSRSRTGRLMAWYLAGYGALRFAVESFRIDEAKEIAGVRINTWMAIVVFVGAAGYLLATARRPTATPSESQPEVETFDGSAPDGSAPDVSASDVSAPDSA